VLAYAMPMPMHYDIHHRRFDCMQVVAAPGAGSSTTASASASDAWLLAAGCGKHAIIWRQAGVAGAMFPAAAESTCRYVVMYPYEYICVAVSIVFVQLWLGY